MSLEKARDPLVPLCFDTSAIFGKVSFASFLGRVRRTFPARRLILPAWVVAERSRQLHEEYGNQFEARCRSRCRHITGPRAGRGPVRSGRSARGVAACDGVARGTLLGLATRCDAALRRAVPEW